MRTNMIKYTSIIKNEFPALEVDDAIFPTPVYHTELLSVKQPKAFPTYDYGAVPLDGVSYQVRGRECTRITWSKSADVGLTILTGIVNVNMNGYKILVTIPYDYDTYHEFIGRVVYNSYGISTNDFIGLVFDSISQVIQFIKSFITNLEQSYKTYMNTTRILDSKEDSPEYNMESFIASYYITNGYHHRNRSC